MIEPVLNQHEMAIGWRKRQVMLQELKDSIRNDTLEEVAQRFDAMPFGDTAASFAKYVRDMKT